ncbi:MAG: glycosyltransferase family 9 protein [Rhodobacteraceae bacterium]|nr:glycosyltransferase family 9 protein [Paracoccaceae bacterium]
MGQLVIIAVLDDRSAEVDSRVRRAEALRRELVGRGALMEVLVRRAEPGAAVSVAAHDPAAVVAVGYDPVTMTGFGMLKMPVIWDFGDVSAETLAGWLDDEAQVQALRTSLAAGDGVIDIRAEVALAIEDRLIVGLSTHGIQAAVAAALNPIVVVMGTGLGNMIYAVPMVRWLAERHGFPVDIIVHNRFDEGVTMFARSPYVRAIYPGLEYAAGKHYALLVSSITAGAMRPPFTADRSLWVDQEHDYNEEGRFVHETRLNFIGLEEVYPDDPNLMEHVPFPFIRDIDYRFPGNRVIGIANGKKSALWAKREWGHMEALVKRLQAEGWEVRSFGLPAEYVPGAVDKTGIPLRDVLHEMADCSYFISYDGGLCHMAEAIGVPTIWLFGSTGTVKNGPVFAHGRVLVSQRACGPCLYKEDWHRCTTPLCMEDITLDQVVTTLEGLEADLTRDGYRQEPAERSNTLMDYEIDALVRPGAPDTQPAYLAERLSLMPGDGVTADTVAVRLLAKGDVVGAASLTSGLIAAGRGTRVTRFVLDSVRQVYDGPVATERPLAERPAPVSAADAVMLAQEFGQMSLTTNDRRSVLEFVIRRFQDTCDHRTCMTLLTALAEHPGFSQGLTRVIHRAIFRLLGRDLTLEDVPVLSAARLENNPSLQRTEKLLNTDVGEVIRANAAEQAELLGMTPGDVIAEAMTPNRARAVRRVKVPGVPLSLGDDLDITLPHNSVVMLLVPALQVKSPFAGSVGSLILFQAQRLAAAGFRPLVVTVGYDNISEGWTVRDSVTYIQAHRCWDAAQYAAILSVYKPGVVLCFGGLETEIDLPAFDVPMVRLSVDGLYDRDGLLIEMQGNTSWGVSKRSEGTSANLLSKRLFTMPDRLRRVPGAPLRALVLLPDAAQFMPFIRVATSMPSIEFGLMTNLRHRGIEKNLTYLVPHAMPDGLWGGAQLLIQFTTGPTTLAAETVRWLERGGRALCNVSGGAEGFGPGLRAPEGGGGTLHWIKAIEATGRDIAATLFELTAI